uniref:Uncharacterized protein n=1 Tax=Lepeophtheirus salmonis TaxID=72036 RepID=A0A0K2V4C5_LEPSM
MMVMIRGPIVKFQGGSHWSILRKSLFFYGGVLTYIFNWFLQPVLIESAALGLRLGLSLHPFIPLHWTELTIVLLTYNNTIEL